MKKKNFMIKTKKLKKKIADKILTLVTARSGSKRIPGKNLKKLGGKPLINWTIDACKKSKYINEIIISSDDLKLLNLCKKQGCIVPFVRPKKLSTNNSSSFEVVKHAIENLNKEYEWLLLLQPTSPYRTSLDIDKSIQKGLSTNCNSLISLAETDKSHLMHLQINKKDEIKTILDLPLHKLNNINSQKMPRTYIINGAIYFLKIKFLLKNKVFFDSNSSYYIMPKERSIDIDSNYDWLIAEALNSIKNRKI